MTGCNDLLQRRSLWHLDLGYEFRGGQRQVLYLAQAQHDAGLRVCVTAPCGAPILQHAEQSGLHIHRLPGRRDFDPRNLVSIARLLCRGDIVHTHDARSASLGALVSFVRRDIMLLHTRRVSYVLGKGWSSLKYRLGRQVVCVGAEVEAAVRQAGIMRTAVIPSAIVLSRYTRSTRNNRGRLGIIGALSPQKGHEQFFRALALLPETPEVWIVGRGELEAHLRALAGTLGIDHRLVWKGEVESPLVLPQLDALIVPSAHGEGSSGVIKEGWAAGVPVVCSDLPANLELVGHERTGLVFANGDSGSLALQLSRLHDAALTAALVDQGLAACREHDAAVMHERYLHEYANLIRQV